MPSDEKPLCVPIQLANYHIITYISTPCTIYYYKIAIMHAEREKIYTSILNKCMKNYNETLFEVD